MTTHSSPNSQRMCPPVHVLVELPDQSILEVFTDWLERQTSTVPEYTSLQVDFDRSIPTCILVRVTRATDDRRSEPAGSSTTT